jgi:hypothetical protein
MAQIEKEKGGQWSPFYLTMNHKKSQNEKQVVI